LDEQHEQERQERERLLAIARETKKHYKSPRDESPPSPGRNLEDVQDLSDSLESLLQLNEDPQLAPNKVERPTFDRAMKPQPRSVERTSQRVRDFSPVMGQNVVSDGLGVVDSHWPPKYSRHTSEINSNGSRFEDTRPDVDRAL